MSLIFNVVYAAGLVAKGFVKTLTSDLRVEKQAAGVLLLPWFLYSLSL